jgi:hypothetical protein
MSAPAGMRALTGACYASGLRPVRPDATHVARLCRWPASRSHTVQFQKSLTTNGSDVTFCVVAVIADGMHVI